MGENGSAPPVVIFDLDRTITRAGTFTPLCIYVAAQVNPLRFLFAPLVIGVAVTTGLKLTGRKTFKSWLLALLVGRRSRPQMSDLVNSFLNRIWDRQIRPDALKALEAERGRGARLYLATASYDFCAERFAERLGLDGCIATRSLWNGDRLSPTIDGENCYGEEKLRRVRAHLGEDGIPTDGSNRPHVTVYTDDRSDLPVLTWADRGVVVDPKPKFEPIARAEGLEVVSW